MHLEPISARRRLAALCLALALAAIMAAALATQASAQTRRPPRYSYVTLSCSAAGYPAGWGSAQTCTVYRPYTTRRAPAQYRR